MVCTSWAAVLGSRTRVDADNRSLTNPLTGEPDAGDPPVRFGGRGSGQPLSLPLSRQTHGPAARGQLPRLRTGSGVQGAKFHLGGISLSTLRACVVCLPHAKKRLLLGKSWWAELALAQISHRAKRK